MPPNSPPKWAQVRYEYEHTDKPVGDICFDHGISPGTLRDRMRRWGWTRRRQPIPAEGPPPMPWIEPAAPLVPAVAPIARARAVSVGRGTARACGLMRPRRTPQRSGAGRSGRDRAAAAGRGRARAAGDRGDRREARGGADAAARDGACCPHAHVTDADLARAERAVEPASA